MIKLTIDGRMVEVEPGTTILHAAERLGIEIPTLCYREGHPPQTSCFLCVVEIEGRDDLAPSCAMAAYEGMVVHTGSPKVIAARQTCLELLFSDHAGSCLGTCSMACPASLDIPGFLAEVEAGDRRKALAIVRQSLALPAALGRVCPSYCESACLRRRLDDALSIRQMHGFLAEDDLQSGDPFVPERRPPTGKRVAIVGAGPAGLSAAFYLALEGHACSLFDANERPGGLLRYGMPEGMLDKRIVDLETEYILNLGVEFRGGWRLGRDATLEQLRAEYGAVFLAFGASLDWTSEKRSVDKAFAESLGLKTARHGIAADAHSHETNLAGVFAGGEATAGPSNVVKAVAAGRAAAEAIGQWLRGDRPEGIAREFHFRGKMTPEETEQFLSRESAPRQDAFARPSLEDMAKAAEQAPLEAARCLGCACESLHDCKLRAYAVRYNVNAHRYRGDRRAMEFDRSHPEIDYQPGKCILCGLCIDAAQQAGEERGVAFVGRGFATRLAGAFDDSMADSLRRAAHECAEVCPAGAFTRKRIKTP